MSGGQDSNEPQLLPESVPTEVQFRESRYFTYFRCNSSAELLYAPKVTACKIEEAPSIEQHAHLWPARIRIHSQKFWQEKKKMQVFELYFLLMFLDEFSFYFSKHFQGKLSDLVYPNPSDTFLSAFALPWHRNSTCSSANV